MFLFPLAMSILLRNYEETVKQVMFSLMGVGTRLKTRNIFDDNYNLENTFPDLLTTAFTLLNYN
jgi:hypothetical protein